MNEINILICDDHNVTHETIAAYLTQEGMTFESAYDGVVALELFEKQQFDIIILDLMMPKLNGLEVCKTIRSKSDIPIIMLTAKGDEVDRIIGLEIGADDYVTKPFSPREVITRIKTILKRTKAQYNEQDSRLVKGHLTIDMDRYEVRMRDMLIEMTPKETELLYFLAKNEGIVFTRDQLLNQIWGYDYFGDTRAVDTQIKRIRKKIQNSDSNIDIKSVYGVGYKFEVHHEKY